MLPWQWCRAHRKILLGLSVLWAMGGCLSPVPMVQSSAPADIDDGEVSIGFGDSGTADDGPADGGDADLGDVGPGEPDAADGAEIGQDAETLEDSSPSDTPSSDLPDDVSAAADSGGDGAIEPADATAAEVGVDTASPPTYACTVFGSAGCLLGEQCYPKDTSVGDPGSYSICASTGAVATGAPCASFNDCVADDVCVLGQCRQFCDITGKNQKWLCKSGVPCQQLAVPDGDPQSIIGVCKPSVACDPLSDQGCPIGQSCAPTGYLKACVVPGPGLVGDPCVIAADCHIGMLCDGGKCHTKCSTTGGIPVCTTGLCQAVLAPDLSPIPDHVGVCQVP